MRILITGGEGVIGKYFKNTLLGLGHSVWSLDLKKEADFVTSIVGSDAVEVLSGILRRTRPDIVVHLAAFTDVVKSWEEVSRVIDVNVMGTVNVLRAIVETREYAQKYGFEMPDTGLVFSSSCTVYGGCEKGEYKKEDSPTVPECPYGVSKLAAETLIKLYSRTYNLKYQILRLGNVYSPFDNKYLLWKMYAVEGINLYGGGEMIRDFVYVGDVLDFLLGVWKAGIWNETWNIGHEPLKVKDVVEYYIKNYGNYIESYQNKRFGEFDEMRLDISKAMSTGWKPKVKLLGEGMKLCLEGFKGR